MKFVYDPPKRAANLVKHGLDLADAARFDWDHAIVRPARNGEAPQSAGLGYS